MGGVQRAAAAGQGGLEDGVPGLRAEGAQLRSLVEAGHPRVGEGHPGGHLPSRQHHTLRRKVEDDTYDQHQTHLDEAVHHAHQRHEGVDNQHKLSPARHFVLLTPDQDLHMLPPSPEEYFCSKILL